MEDVVSPVLRSMSFTQTTTKGNNMMDEQTIRRINHQRRKDVYKVDALKLRKELADLDKQKDLNRFLKIVQYVLIAMMLITFIGIITVNNNAEISLGEKVLQMWQQKGWIE